MLYAKWPVEKISHVLDRLQSGNAVDAEGGEKSPLYIATEIIASKTRGKVIPALKQVALIINAALKVENGVTTSARVLRAEVEKGTPNPTFPNFDVHQAA
jgi:hypothetical protein